jgi:hypothetical protein
VAVYRAAGASAVAHSRCAPRPEAATLGARGCNPARPACHPTGRNAGAPGAEARRGRPPATVAAVAAGLQVEHAAAPAQVGPLLRGRARRVAGGAAAAPAAARTSSARRHPRRRHGPRQDLLVHRRHAGARQRPHVPRLQRCAPSLQHPGCNSCAGGCSAVLRPRLRPDAMQVREYVATLRGTDLTSVATLLL